MSQGLKDRHPEIKWKEINGFRNISIHEYFSLDNVIVWEIANNDLPGLSVQFRKVLEEL